MLHFVKVVLSAAVLLVWQEFWTVHVWLHLFKKNSVTVVGRSVHRLWVDMVMIWSHLPRYSTVAGVPLSDLLTQDEIDGIVQRTRKGGAEIVALLQTGSAYYAPAKSTAIMIEAILKDTKQIHPCAVYLDGEYGYYDVVSGVPVMLGANGVEKIIEITLDDAEKKMFADSCQSVQTLIDTLNTNNFFQGA